MLLINKTPHKRVQVEAFDNAVTDTVSGDAEMSIYDPSNGHDVVSLQLFKPHASGIIRSSLWDTIRIQAITTDLTVAGGVVSTNYINADSSITTGLKKQVYNNALEIKDGTQSNGYFYKSDANGNGSWSVPVTSGATGSRPTPLYPGQLYFNTTSVKLEFWNGTAWAQITSVP